MLMTDLEPVLPRNIQKLDFSKRLASQEWPHSCLCECVRSGTAGNGAGHSQMECDFVRLNVQLPHPRELQLGGKQCPLRLNHAPHGGRPKKAAKRRPRSLHQSPSKLHCHNMAFLASLPSTPTVQVNSSCAATRKICPLFSFLFDMGRNRLAHSKPKES